MPVKKRTKRIKKQDKKKKKVYVKVDVENLVEIIKAHHMLISLILMQSKTLAILSKGDKQIVRPEKQDININITAKDIEKVMNGNIKVPICCACLSKDLEKVSDTSGKYLRCQKCGYKIYSRTVKYK